METNENKFFEYSTDVIDENIKDDLRNGRLLVKEVMDKEKSDEKHFWAIVLKYNLDNVDQEVTLGILEETSELSEKAKNITELLEKQLILNKKEEKGFIYYDRLDKYLKNKNISFHLTPEGIKILSHKKKDRIQIPRTFFTDKYGRVFTTLSDNQLESLNSDNSNKSKDYIKEQKNFEKWRERRKKILNKLDKDGNEEEIENFLKGEKITYLLEETSKHSASMRQLSADYFMEALDKAEDKTNLLKYLNMKEKGFAINVKIVLEAQQDRCYGFIQEETNKEEVNQERINQISHLLDRINDNLQLFELIKQHRDWNASYTYRAKELSISEVKELCKLYNSKDTEILQYLDAKKDVLLDKKLNVSATQKNDYRDSESMRKLYRFLISSTLRDYTNPNSIDSAPNIIVQNTQYFDTELFESIIKELVEYNSEYLKTYNKYAEKSEGVYTYPLKDVIDENNSTKNISNIVKSISAKLLADKEEEVSDSQMPEDHEEK